MNAREILREIKIARDGFSDYAINSNRRACNSGSDTFKFAICSGESTAYAHCRNALSALIGEIEGKK